MNASSHSIHAATPRTPVAVPVQADIPAGPRQHRARDFGIGYGNSSGYGLDKRYTSDWGAPRFRFR